MPEFVTALHKEALRPGECRTVAVCGRAVALYNVGGRFYATDNLCPHKRGPLGDGFLEGAVVVCPWHNWRFEVITGANTVRADIRVPCFEVRVRGEAVQVKL